MGKDLDKNYLPKINLKILDRASRLNVISNESDYKSRHVNAMQDRRLDIHKNVLARSWNSSEKYIEKEKLNITHNIQRIELKTMSIDDYLLKARERKVCMMDQTCHFLYI